MLPTVLGNLSNSPPTPSPTAMSFLSLSTGGNWWPWWKKLQKNGINKIKHNQPQTERFGSSSHRKAVHARRSAVVHCILIWFHASIDFENGFIIEAITWPSGCEPKPDFKQEGRKPIGAQSISGVNQAKWMNRYFSPALFKLGFTQKAHIN